MAEKSLYICTSKISCWIKFKNLNLQRADSASWPTKRAKAGKTQVYKLPNKQKIDSFQFTKMIFNAPGKKKRKEKH